MMLRVQRERMNARVLPDARASTRRRYGLDGAPDGARCQDHAIVMHPGPMNRGMEITADVADSRPLDDRRAGHQRRRRPDGRALPAARRQPSPPSGEPRTTTHDARYLDPRTPRSSAASPTDLLLARRRDRRDRRRASTPAGAEVVDADGLVALPGLVDLHTHLREPGREDAETVETGTRGRGARRLHRRARDGQHRPGRRHRRRRRAGLAARPRGRPLRRATRSAPSPSGWRGEQLAELGAMADSAARVRVFSDDGKCVCDAVLMRRALEYVKAFDGVVAQHAQEPRLTEGAQMNEGELSGRARAAPAGRPSPRRRSSPATCLLAAHVGSRLHVCHVSTAGSVEIVRWAKRKGWTSPPRSRPHHLLLTDELAATYDPIYKVNPPLRTGRRRRGAARRRWPTAPSTSSPPTTPRTRARTRTASGPPPRSACSAWRPRCRSCSRRWSTPGCSTGPASPTGCPSRPARIGRLAGHGRPLEVGEPANLVLVRPGGAPRRSTPAELGLAVAATRRTPAASCPAGSSRPSCAARPTVLDGTAGPSERRRARAARARARGRPDLPRRAYGAARRDLRRGGLHHRHDRLPGDAHRPVVPPPGRRDDRPAHRQHRHQRRGRRSRAGSGSRATSCATRPGVPSQLALAAHASTTSCATRASSASAASTPAR